jgi:hypothetical protein
VGVVVLLLAALGIWALTQGFRHGGAPGTARPASLWQVTVVTQLDTLGRTGISGAQQA